MREDIASGQVVSSYVVDVRRDGGTEWSWVSKGTTIGYKKLDRIPATEARYVRLTVQTVAPAPKHVELRLFAG
jgi:alpha-L-fucosidase